MSFLPVLVYTLFFLSEVEMIKKIPDHEYFDQPELSSSLVKMMITSTPKEVRAYLQGKLPQPSGVEIGSAVHAMLFGGNDIEVSPFDSYRTKEAREWRDSRPKHSIVLSQAENSLAAELSKSIRKLDFKGQNLSKIISDLRKIDQVELSCFQTIFDNDFKCKFDAIDVENGIIFDVKTTAESDPDGFNKQAGNLLYDVQQVVYTKIAEAEFNKPFDFYFIVVSKNQPFDSWIQQIEIDPAVEDQIAIAIETYQEADRRQMYLGWSYKIHKTKVKNWAIDSRLKWGAAE